MEGVRVTALNKTAVNVSWNKLIILDVSILNYVVVYSPALGRRKKQIGEAVFPPSAMSGIIGGLRPGTTYQFQVYATVEVVGIKLHGEPSPVTNNSTVNLRGEILIFITSLKICSTALLECSIP